MEFDDDEGYGEFINCINKMWNNTRMIVNRGFTPNELLDKETKSKKNDFGEKGKRKVYTNDPCSCGSGKKYKNCCRNK